MFASTVSPYSAWHYALPSHHEVCGCAEGEQDLCHPCYTPCPLILKSFMANGKHFITLLRKGLHSEHCNSTCCTIKQLTFIAPTLVIFDIFCTLCKVFLPK